MKWKEWEIHCLQDSPKWVLIPSFLERRTTMCVWDSIHTKKNIYLYKWLKIFLLIGRDWMFGNIAMVSFMITQGILVFSLLLLYLSFSFDSSPVNNLWCFKFLFLSFFFGAFIVLGDEFYSFMTSAAILCVCWNVLMLDC